MKKRFILEINVPDDFTPGKCEFCPYINHYGDKEKQHCDLDPKDLNPLCNLGAV